MHRIITLALLSLILVACGGGSGGGSAATPPPPAPPSISYPSTPSWVVGQAIPTLTPTVSGVVTRYSISPALPAGLSLDATSGVISGVPTAVAAATNYTVTASNAGGNAAAAVSITVNDVAPTISYGSTNLAFTSGSAISVLAPSHTGGTPTGWTINPTLPSGLAFDTSDGRITGNPTDVSPSTPYVVTATNSGGQSQVTLTIIVTSGLLLDLGHADYITFLRLTSDRAMSQDLNGHWVLWNAVTRAIVASGDSVCFTCNTGHRDHYSVDLAGATAVIQLPTGLEIRAASDGRVLSTIDTQISSWKLATDGTYVSATSAAGLSAWAPSGVVRVARPGDYSKALMFAAPSEIRVAKGPAGDDVIETVSTAGGASAISPRFQGLFNSWFVDGERFLTNVSTNVWVFSKDAVQLDLTSLPNVENLTGQGNWFWITKNYKAVVYAVGASSTPAGTYGYSTSTNVVASGTTFAALDPGFGRLTIVDLSGPILSSAEYIVPHAYLQTYAAGPGASWLVGNRYGVVLDGASLAGTPKYFGYGQAWSIAGSSERVVVATASGKILSFDARTKALESTISFSSSHVELSSDGTVLAAAENSNDAQYLPDRSIEIYSMPGALPTYTWTYSFPQFGHLSLSASGLVLEHEGEVSSPTGGPVVWTRPPKNPAPDDVLQIRLSPSGSLIAFSNGPLDPTAATQVFRNGVLSTAMPGSPVEWLTETRVLVNTYINTKVGVRYDACFIYDDLGNKMSSPALPELRRVQSLGADSLYSPDKNSIFSVTTGAATWTTSTPSRSVGAVAGPFVVFASGAVVRAEPH